MHYADNFCKIMNNALRDSDNIYIAFNAAKQPDHLAMCAYACNQTSGALKLKPTINLKKC